MHPQLNHSFITTPGRFISLALRRLLSQTQLRYVFADDIKLVGIDRAIPAFHAAAHTPLHTFTGGG